MPLPKTRDIGRIIRQLKNEKPSMPYKQKIAIALETARKAGARIPRKKKKVSGKRYSKRHIALARKMLKK